MNNHPPLNGCSVTDFRYLHTENPVEWEQIRMELETGFHVCPEVIQWFKDELFRRETKIEMLEDQIAQWESL